MLSRIHQRRQNRSEHQTPKVNLKRILTVLIILAAVLLFLFIWGELQQTSHLDLSQNILFVQPNLDGTKGDIILAHISPKDSKIEVAIFPPEMSVELLGGYGNYPLRSVYPLLKLDKKSPNFIKAAYTYSLNLPIDEVVLADQPSPDTMWWQLLTYKFHSQMSFTQRLSVYRFVQNIGSHQVTVHPLQNASEWQSFTRQFRFNSISPDCAVAVINTTEVAGAGSTVTRVLENSGIPVIRLSDAPDQIPQTQLLVLKAEPFCQEVTEHLGAVFPFATHLTINAKAMSSYRANLVILIGEDFGQEFVKKN